jgi:hypothetical protein
MGGARPSGQHAGRLLQRRRPIRVIMFAVVNGLLGFVLVRACSWAFGQETSSSAWLGALVPGDRP